jgi:hypothetical protein
MLRGGELLSKNIDPRLGVTFGIVVLAAFVVVLAVSLATLGWSGPGEYRGVMLTLVVSLLVMIVAALAVAWVVASRKLPMGDAGTTPSDEIQRIRKELDAGIGPTNEILRIRKEMEVIRNSLESLVREAVDKADRERAGTPPVG